MLPSIPGLPPATQWVRNRTASRIATKTVSLFQFGLTKTIKALNGNKLLITDDNNAFTQKAPKPGFRAACKTCGREFTHAPALRAHEKMHKPSSLGARQIVNTPDWELCLASTLCIAWQYNGKPPQTVKFDQWECNLAASWHAPCDNWIAVKAAKAATSCHVGKNSEEEVVLKGRRGAKNRRAYSLRFKLGVVFLVEMYSAAGIIKDPQAAVAAHKEISPSLVCKWMKTAAKLKETGCSKRAKGMNRMKHPREKFPGLTKTLKEEILELRSEGVKVSPFWARVRARQIINETDPDVRFTASSSWFENFLRLSHLSIRKKTNVKKLPIEQRLPKLKRWHARLEDRIIASRQAARAGEPFVLTQKWGAYFPEHRYSLDQVPFQFASSGTTLEATGSKRVWVAQGSESTDDKRFCTIQVTHTHTVSLSLSPSLSLSLSLSLSMFSCLFSAGATAYGGKRCTW
jgi:hypothetical protein